MSKSNKTYIHELETTIKKLNNVIMKQGENNYQLQEENKELREIITDQTNDLKQIIDDQSHDIKQYRKEIEQLKEENKALNDEMNIMAQAYDRTKKDIKQLTKENEKLKERFVNKELKELQKVYDRYNRILELSEALQEE